MQGVLVSGLNEVNLLLLFLKGRERGFSGKDLVREVFSDMGLILKDLHFEK